jgi:hypothetical protein
MLNSNPDVPSGKWYKTFPKFTLAGEGEVPKTFLTRVWFLMARKSTEQRFRTPVLFRLEDQPPDGSSPSHENQQYRYPQYRHHRPRQDHACRRHTQLEVGAWRWDLWVKHRTHGLRHNKRSCRLLVVLL